MPSTFVTYLFLWVLPALLPPEKEPGSGGGGGGSGNNDSGDADGGGADHASDNSRPQQQQQQEDYYEVLQVSPSSSPEEIRKAYKRISLQLHPDKILQRGATEVTDEQRQQYQTVQEAHHVLCDKSKRQLYDQLGRSPRRYHFFASNEYQNPATLYSNLGKAHACAKSRIVLLLVIFMASLLVVPILVCSKVNQILDGDEEGGALASTDWIVLLIPLWILQGLFLLMSVGLTVAAIRLTGGENSCAFLGSLLEQVLFLVGEILVVLKWDRTYDEDWVYVLSPFYATFGLRVVLSLMMLRTISAQVQRMVTPRQFHEDILPQHIANSEGDGDGDGEAGGLSEEARQELESQYIIVHVPDELQDNGELPEELKVEYSPEYNHVNEQYFQVLANLINRILFGVPTLVLLVLKLDGHLEGKANWWVVFIPVLVYLGTQLLWNCHLCCFANLVGDEVVVNVSSATDNEDENDGEERDDDGNGVAATTGREAKVSHQFFVSAEGNIHDFTTTSEARGDNAAETTTTAPVSSSNLTAATTTSTATMETTTSSAPSSSADDKVAATTTAAAPLLSPSTIRPDGDDDDNNDANSIPVLQPSPEVADTTTTATSTNNDGINNNISSSNNNNDDDDDDVDGDDVVVEDTGEGDDEFYVDEETFRQWQSAYQEAEANAMEVQSRAQIQCCGLLFQITILCLIVGKLEAADGSGDNADGDVGYDAFWILLPIFLVAGCLLCCCACVIYGAGAEGLDGLVDRVSSPSTEDGGDGDDAERQQQQASSATTSPTSTAPQDAGDKASPIVLAPPPPLVPPEGDSTATPGDGMATAEAPPPAPVTTPTTTSTGFDADELD